MLYIYLNILKHTAFRCQKISLHLFFYVVSSALFADLFIDASNSVNKWGKNLILLKRMHILDDHNAYEHKFQHFKLKLSFKWT